MCVYYGELNKNTTRDAYPLQLPDEVQDQLSGSTVFTTIDLQSAYWQEPVNPNEQEKSTFCLGPGMELYEFRRMPFGLSGVPSMFQRLMERILWGLPFFTMYINDILVHLTDTETHNHHLGKIAHCLAYAGLTLRGKKCRIGLMTMGHVFSGKGMTPGACFLWKGYDT